MFKTSQANIPQIKATLKAYPQGCYFHGCGNIYIDKNASDFRQNFTNPNSEESTYRIHFTSVDQVPATVEELNKMLMASRNEEMIKEKMNKVSKGITTIKVEEEPQPAATATSGLTDEELEFQRLLKEEELKAQKAK